MCLLLLDYAMMSRVVSQLDLTRPVARIFS
jgi:hypothetical protein